MSTVIEQLIKEAEAKKEAEAREDKAKTKQFLDEVEAKIAEYLGDLWQVFKPFVRVRSLDRSRGFVICTVNGDGLADLELAPFTIHHGSYQRGVVLGYSEHQIANYHHIGEFLAERREAFHKSQAEAHTKAMNQASRQLWHGNVKTGEEADAALSQLLELEPDDADKWRGMREAWQEWYDEELERKAYSERIQAKTAEYEAAFKTYWDEHDAVVEDNQARLKLLQLELDSTFKVYKLTYAYMASDEEEGNYLETGSVYVTDEEPDEADDFWMAYERGALVRRRYYNPVSIEGPFPCKPTDDTFHICGQITVYDDRTNYVAEIHFNPAEMSRETVEDMINTTVASYLDEPPIPNELDQGRVYDVQRRVMRHDDMDF